MRSIAYVAAFLAAAGIMFYLTMTPQDQPAETTASSTPAEKVELADVELASMTLNVPEMHCPFACYPSVKKNLEGQSEVMSVELVPQKQEGVIDNPQVVVKYSKEAFDADKAIALLDAAGFSGSTLVD